MDTVLRIFIIYVLLVAGLRVLGKREFGQLSPLELITLLMIPEVVSQSLTHQDPSLINAIVGVTTLFSLVFVTSLLTHRFKRLEEVISDKPSVLVEHGKFIEQNMNKERLSPEEIYAVMHKSGLYELRQVRWAVLETDGEIAIIPEEETSQPEATADEMKGA